MPLSKGISAIDVPLAYIKASPMARAKYICSPILMVHSDLDGFTVYHYEALFSAMYRLGKRAELVRYYGEGHGLRSPGNIRDFYERVLAFLDKYVATSARHTGSELLFQVIIRRYVAESSSVGINLVTS